MQISGIIQKEIKVETAKTRQILERITDEHLAWKPHEKSMSLKDLAVHVVELHNWMGLALQKDKFDFHTDYTRLETPTAATLIERLDAGLQANLDAVGKLSDADWESQWTLCAGDHIISQSSKISAARFIIQNHLIHHRGQLSVYLRLLNIPVPGIYGPSADEKM